MNPPHPSGIQRDVVNKVALSPRFSTVYFCDSCAVARAPETVPSLFCDGTSQSLAHSGWRSARLERGARPLGSSSPLSPPADARIVHPTRMLWNRAPYSYHLVPCRTSPCRMDVDGCLQDCRQRVFRCFDPSFASLIESPRRAFQGISCRIDVPVDEP